MLNLIVALTALAVAAPQAEVKVKTLAGEALIGRLEQLTSAEAKIATDAGARVLAREELLSIDGELLHKTEKPLVWIELVDGSQLLANEFGTASGKATIELLGGRRVEIPTRSIISVRFRAQDAALAEQWRAITAAAAGGDQIVRRQTSTRTVEDAAGDSSTVTTSALDPLEGVVLDVGPETIQFDFGGDKIDVKREKVEGIVYFHPAKRTFPAPLCRLTETAGSRWSLKSVELMQGQLLAASLAGVEFTLPLGEMSKLDFAAGNVAYLSELEPDRLDESFGLQPKAMTASFAQLFKPGLKRRFGSEMLTLKGAREVKDADDGPLDEKYDEGLALHATTRLDYQIPPGFKSFRAIAGMDDSVGATGHCKLIVLGDNRELFSREFDVAGNYLPVRLNLDISGMRRLTIVVEAGSGLEIGDQLNLCEARMTK
jgi:hypothetical protein